MPNNNRRRGDEFERRTKADLEMRGWVVVRSAGSLGPADLVALHHSRPPIIVSCKIPGYLRPTENDVLIETSLLRGYPAYGLRLPGQRAISRGLQSDHKAEDAMGPRLYGPLGYAQPRRRRHGSRDPMTKTAQWRAVLHTYPCATCGAGPGANCRSPSGRVQWLPHVDRYRQAQERNWRAGDIPDDTRDEPNEWP